MQTLYWQPIEFLSAMKVSKPYWKMPEKKLKKGNLVVLGGDFNEPSHLDWQQNTKDMRDHNGLVINWDCSVLLYEAGFKDAYREIYPDAVTHPEIYIPSRK